MKKLISLVAISAILGISYTKLTAQPQALTPGITTTVLNAVAASVGNSSVFGLPAAASTCTWQTSFAVSPMSITLQFQTSLDNTVFSTVDTSTSVTGESRNIDVAGAVQMRLRINAVNMGSGITANVNCKTNASILSTSNTFFGTQIFNNVVITGTTIFGSGCLDTGIYFASPANTLGCSANLTWVTSTNAFRVGGTPQTDFDPGGGDIYDFYPQSTFTGTISDTFLGPQGQSIALQFGIITTIDPSADDPSFTQYLGTFISAIIPSTNTKLVADSSALGLFMRWDGTDVSGTSQIRAGFISTENTTPIHQLTGFQMYTISRANADLNTPLYATTQISSGTTTIAAAAYLRPIVFGAATATSLYGSYVITPVIGGGGSAGVSYAYYSQAQGGSGATNEYDFWYDEQGVYRGKADNTFNAVYQTITALYNPQFTKYTPGAANFERIVQQWESNVAYIRTEVGAGGGNALRDIGLGGANIHLDADVIVLNGKAIETNTTSGNTYLFKVYDNNTGPAYVTWATITNGNTPSIVIAPPAGGTTISVQASFTSSDGTAGLTQTCVAAVVALTIKDGLVTAVTCP